MQHHEATITAFTQAQAVRPDVVGVVVVGSVARGDERPDSDVDVYVVVTDAAYAAAAARGEVAYMSATGVAYEHGYVDVKLASPAYLQSALDHGDDPTRASFDRGRVVLDRNGGLAEVVGAMTSLPDTVWADRVQAYRAQLALHGGYFLVQAAGRGDRFLVAHAGVHAAYAAGRCVLAGHHRLFRGQKYLSLDVHALPDEPAGFATAWQRLVDEPSPGAAETVTQLLDGWVGAPLTVDQSLSRFIADNELAWLNRTIPPEFW